MAMDLNVYNYLMTGYNTKPEASKYGAHKTSELRSIVRDIAKRTKSSPIYLVKLSDDKQAYALNVKESSIALHDAFEDLMTEDESSVFGGRKAVSSQTGDVSVNIDTEDYEKLPSPFSMEVHGLAKQQVNVSKEFYDSSRSLEEGLYRFRIRVNDDSYDFQYNIKKDARHGEVIGGLADFITKARIGIQAQPVSREAGKIAMRISTDMTGSPDGEPILSFEDRPDGQHSEGITSYYGLNRIVQNPENASFEINGVEKHSMSNQFKLAGSLQIQMKRISEQPAQITYTPDSDKIINGVRNVLDHYNQMIDSSWNYAEKSGHTPKLVREMQSVLMPFQSDLESCGLTFNDQGYLEMDDYLAEQSAMDGSFQELFGAGSRLSSRMLAKMNYVKLDPMEYVDKTLVSYPNTSKPAVGYAYTTSLYSGMLFNYYC